MLDYLDGQFTAFVKLSNGVILSNTYDTRKKCKDWVDEMGIIYPVDEFVTYWIRPVNANVLDFV